MLLCCVVLCRVLFRCAIVVGVLCCVAVVVCCGGVVFCVVLS